MTAIIDSGCIVVEQAGALLKQQWELDSHRKRNGGERRRSTRGNGRRHPQVEFVPHGSGFLLPYSREQVLRFFKEKWLFWIASFLLRFYNEITRPGTP
jgi:hypothetical protein